MAYSHHESSKTILNIYGKADPVKTIATGINERNIKGQDTLAVQLSGHMLLACPINGTTLPCSVSLHLLHVVVTH